MKSPSFQRVSFDLDRDPSCTNPGRAGVTRLITRRFARLESKMIPAKADPPETPLNDDGGCPRTHCRKKPESLRPSRETRSSEPPFARVLIPGALQAILRDA